MWVYTKISLYPWKKIFVVYYNTKYLCRKSIFLKHLKHHTDNIHCNILRNYGNIKNQFHFELILTPHSSHPDKCYTLNIKYAITVSDIEIRYTFKGHYLSGWVKWNTYSTVQYSAQYRTCQMTHTQCFSSLIDVGRRFRSLKRLFLFDLFILIYCFTSLRKLWVKRESFCFKSVTTVKRKIVINRLGFCLKFENSNYGKFYYYKKEILKAIQFKVDT